MLVSEFELSDSEESKQEVLPEEDESGEDALVKENKPPNA